MNYIFFCNGYDGFDSACNSIRVRILLKRCSKFNETFFLRIANDSCVKCYNYKKVNIAFNFF